MANKKPHKTKKPDIKTGNRGHSCKAGVSPYLGNISRAEAYFSALVFIAVAVLVFYPPYFRGLFFNEDMFVYHIITGLIFILVWIEKISRKEYNFLETPLDWTILAYAGAYLLSLTGAVHIGEAIYGFLKALNYFMVYFMVTQVVRDYRRYEYMLKIILASGVGVAAIGILAAVGLSQYPSAFTYENGVARILSTLQYPNTTAAYLAVISLIGVTLWIREKNHVMKLIYGTSIYLLMLVVLAALSKGAWLIFILGAILLLLGMPGIYRFKSVYIMGLAGMATLFTYSRFIAEIPAVSGCEPAAALKRLLLGLVIIGLGQAVWDLGLVLYHRMQRPWLTVYIISLGLAVFILSYYYLPVNEMAGIIAPDSLKARIAGITDTSSGSYTSRLDFARCGMDIVKEYPITGAGAGGWNALYHQYQNYLTWTTEPHNHFVQVAVEAGSIGFLAFISVWVCLFWALFNIFRAIFKSSVEGLTADKLDRWILNWGTAAAALAFGVHAAMDFDLSLGAMVILLWTFLALINTGAKIETPDAYEIVFRPVINMAAAIILVAIILFCGQNFSMALNCAQQGDGLLMEITAPKQGVENKEDELRSVEEWFGRATLSDPYNGNYHGNLAQVYALQFSQAAQSQNPAALEYYDKTKKEIKRAGELSPYNIKLRNVLVNISLGINDLEGAIEQSRWAIKANPNDINAYEGFIQISLKATELYLNQNNFSKASYYAQEIVKQANAIEMKRKKIDPKQPWSGRALILNPSTQLTLGKAQFLLGQYQEALLSLQPLLPLVQKGELKAPEIMTWYLACLDKTGNSIRAKGLRPVLEKEGTQSVQLYQRLLELKPLPLIKQEGN